MIAFRPAVHPLTLLLIVFLTQVTTAAESGKQSYFIPVVVDAESQLVESEIYIQAPLLPSEDHQDIVGIANAFAGIISRNECSDFENLVFTGKVQNPPLKEEYAETPGFNSFFCEFITSGAQAASAGPVFGSASRAYAVINITTVDSKNSPIVASILCENGRCGILPGLSALNTLFSFAILSPSPSWLKNIPHSDISSVSLDSEAAVNLVYRAYLTEEAPEALVKYAREYEKGFKELYALVADLGPEAEFTATLPGIYERHSSVSVLNDIRTRGRYAWLSWYKKEGEVAMIIDGGDFQVYLNKAYLEGQRGLNCVTEAEITSGSCQIVEFGVMSPLRQLLFKEPIRAHFVERYQMMKDRK